MIVYLIGVNHKVQFINDSSDPDLNNSFAKYLGELIDRFGATLVAEEFSEEALSVWRATASLTKTVAKKKNVRHKFCDPGKEERKLIEADTKTIIHKLGIPGNKYYRQDDISKIEKEDFKLRELYWLEKIREETDDRAIFICGQRHVESFYKLLIDNNIKCFVASENWGVDGSV
ncbi:MAG: hypothetical protein KBC69_01370 [Candidatus Magasanikbacteria bacterium]|nr:hypothetical protein [Candidatus Magasanikbacteria bacterium]